jgi:hypothetical protein
MSEQEEELTDVEKVLVAIYEAKRNLVTAQEFTLAGILRDAEKLIKNGVAKLDGM